MSIQKKGDTYYVVIMYHDAKGKKKYKWIKSGTSIRDAQKLERQMLTDVNRGQLVISDKIIVKDFLIRWMDAAIKPNKRPATISNYENQIKNLVRSLGDITLEKLNALTIQEHYNAESKRGLKPTSIQYQHAVLKQALDKAVAWRFLTNNPCDVVDAPKRNKPKNAVYTPEQTQVLLDMAQDTNLYLPLLLGFLCGLRRGEICGLRTLDIDMNKNAARITHSLDRMDKEDAIKLKAKGEIVWFGCENKTGTNVLALGPVKTDDSEGFIPLSSLVMEAIKLEEERQEANRVEFGTAYQENDFVWAWEDGRPYDPDYFYHSFKKLIKKYNNEIRKDEELTDEEKEAKLLPDIRLHDMRHTHATLLLREKIDIKIVSKKLRHKRASFTSDYYQHVQNDMQNETATAMDKLFSNNKPH